ncbi:MAG: universal stress protein [Desulfarculus sp.]|nr:universal stress protein [Desulfarculus sp.]
MTPRRVALLAVLVGAVTALHYFTSINQLPLHIIYREFYLAPIILAGLWGGRKTGLTTSLLVSLIYLPHIFMLSGAHLEMMHVDVEAPTAETYVGNFLALAVFNLAGFLAGSYADARTGYLKKSQTAYQPTTYGGDFLLCVDNSGSAQYAIKYFADVLGGLPGIKVTLLWVFREQDPANAAEEANLESYHDDQMSSGQAALESAREVLTKGGVPVEAIQVKSMTADNKSSISDIVLEELAKGNYHTVVLGKRELSKAEEFLFGSLSIKLVREARANVLSVKVPTQ